VSDPDARLGEFHEPRRLEHSLPGRGLHTLISEWVTVRSDLTLLRLLKASGATPAELEEVQGDMKQQGRGSTFIEVNETGRRLLPSSHKACHKKSGRSPQGLLPPNLVAVA
jgi:hypothetical protein